MTDKLTSRWLIVALVVVGAIFAVTSNWPLNYGIDLRGGTTISYEIPDKVLREFQETGQDLDAAVEQVIDVISTRIDTLGLRELKVRREGTSRIVLDAPDMSRAEREDIKRRMIQLGSLKFLVGVGRLRSSDVPTQTLDVPGATPGTTDKFPFDETKANEQAGWRLRARPGSSRSRRSRGPRDRSGRSPRWSPCRTETSLRASRRGCSTDTSRRPRTPARPRPFARSDAPSSAGRRRPCGGTTRSRPLPASVWT